MTEKEKADCLIELHKEQLGKFKQTRDIEFKINISLWSLIIIASYSLKENILLDKCSEFVIFSLSAVLITLGHYFLWMKPIQKSENKDDFYINSYRRKIEELADIEISKSPKLKKQQPWKYFEVAITLVLFIFVGLYLSF
jgi:hypothetical protein